MPLKRKRVKVPKSCHHPSQSSIDVPSRFKEEIKGLQDNRCWLCDCKAHETLRPLQICHIYPQAISQRFSVRLPFNPLWHGGLFNRSSRKLISLAAYNFTTSMTEITYSPSAQSVIGPLIAIIGRLSPKTPSIGGKGLNRDLR